jgi:hypothetical protein
VLTEPAGDSSVRVVNALFEQQWFGGGLEARWQPRDNVRLWAELLGGVRRANFVNGSSELLMPVDSILSTGIRADRASAVSRNLDGTHRSLDESVRWIAGGSWSFAQGDIAQEPVIPAGLSPDDHARFETVEFQRAAYVRTNENLENSLTTWRLGWDRNWRYYLNREVKTSLDVEFLTFDYDARTAWEHQLWFPTGNFWLEHGGYRVGVERLTVLGSEDVVSVRPRIEVPLWRERNVKFAWRGDFEGVELDLRPRFAESVFQLGFDLTRTVRIQSDTRWAKYDAPVLRLDGGFVSQFTEAILKLAPGVEVSLGMGIDPWVLDPNTNEYAYIGRDVFLNNRYVSGFYAETNYLSGAPVIRAAEQALQDERRVQLEAIIRF